MLVAEFVQACLIERRIERIPDFISADRYHQHSAEVPDGLAAFMERFGAEGCPLSYQACELMVGEGNFVAALSRARWGDQPLCQVDLFRVEAGKNVGHWDNSEPVPPEPEWVNSGKF